MFKKRGQPKPYQGFFARHKRWIATATLIGTIVGAGVLAIPYVIAKAGFIYGSLLILILGLAFLFLNLFLGEIVLRTKEQHQLAGYIAKYLGPWGKRLMGVSMVFGIYGALIAYSIGEGQAFKAIFGGPPLIYSLLFFLAISIIIYHGVKATGKAEMFIIALLLLDVFLIGLFSYQKLQPAHFTLFNPVYFFLPYGVILFAFMGTAAIPEMQEELEKEKQKMKKAILIGSIVPIFLYFLFAMVVIGLVGLENFEVLPPNERIATVALSFYSYPALGILANLFAIFAMFTSSISLGVALSESYNYDFKIPKKTAFFLTLAVPLFFLLTNLTTFIAVIGLTGALAGGLDGILIVLAYWKAKKLGERSPEYSLKSHKLLGWILIFLFSLGLLYQVGQAFF